MRLLVTVGCCSYVATCWCVSGVSAFVATAGSGGSSRRGTICSSFRIKQNVRAAKSLPISMVADVASATTMKAVGSAAQSGDERPPVLTGVRCWTEEFEQERYHQRQVMVDDGKLRKLEHNRLGDIEKRDMLRVLERGYGKSPGGMPHFDRIAEEAVAKAKKIKPRTINIVLHEWIEPRLTHHIAQCGGGGSGNSGGGEVVAGADEELTIFVGNEHFVDNDLLHDRGHMLMTTGGTKKACLPQMVACMVVVMVVNTLRNEGILPRNLQNDNDIAVNVFADGIAVDGVLASCLPHVRAATGAEVTVQRFREDWESILAATSEDGEAEIIAPQAKEGTSLAQYLQNLCVSSTVPELTGDMLKAFVEAREAYREELQVSRQPLLMDAEGAGTHSVKRRPPFYQYHKLHDCLLVAVASDPGVVQGLRARTGGIGAAEPAAVRVVEGSHQLPNSADSVLAVMLTEAFLAKRQRNGAPEREDAGKIYNEDLEETTIGVNATNGFVRQTAVDGRSGGGGGSTRETQEGYFEDSVTILVGKDGVLQDLVEIGEFNGVKIARVPDLPHERVRGRKRARNIKRTDSYRKTGQGVPRIPLGRRS